MHVRERACACARVRGSTVDLSYVRACGGGVGSPRARVRVCVVVVVVVVVWGNPPQTLMAYVRGGGGGGVGSPRAHARARANGVRARVVCMCAHVRVVASFRIAGAVHWRAQYV